VAKQPPGFSLHCVRKDSITKDNTAVEDSAAREPVQADEVIEGMRIRSANPLCDAELEMHHSNFQARQAEGMFSP